MRILITGSTGMLASSLIEVLEKGDHELFLGRRNKVAFPNEVKLDITSQQDIDRLIDSEQGFDVILHTAAFTNVDACETQKDTAFSVNVEGTQKVLELAVAKKAFVVFFSSDYVFRGDSDRPYTEKDPPDPVSVYGMTKFEAEKKLLNYSRKVIFRIPWLYGGGRQFHNFVNTMLSLEESGKDTLEVVTDQIGSPTYTHFVADVVFKLLEKISKEKDPDLGVFHLSNDGFCSWNELAHKIFELTKAHVTVLPTDSQKMARPAKRPAYSVLNTAKICRYLDIKPPHWEQSLKEYLSRLDKFEGV